MGNIHLVTGKLGYDHIESADQGAFNAALIGTGDFVLNKGGVFSARYFQDEEGHKVSVSDGELMMQGRFIRFFTKTPVELPIDNGTVGMMRNDLIVVRYTKDASGKEDANLVVIKGTAVASNPLDPDCTEGDITNGATLHEYPLWRIPIDGYVVGTPVALFGEPYNESMQTLPDIRNQMAQLTSNIFSVAARVETGSYTGDGSMNKVISTSLNPKLMIISNTIGGAALGLDTTAGMTTIIRGVSKYLVFNNNTNKVYMRAVLSNKRIELGIAEASNYNYAYASHLYNASGETYYYVIVGN